MNIFTLVKTGAVVQLARMGLGRRRRVILRRQRRNRGLGLLALSAGAAAAWFVVTRARAGQAPEWPSRKKLRKDARRAEAARRAQGQANVPPPAVHVQREAPTELKAPLADLKH